LRQARANVPVSVSEAIEKLRLFFAPLQTRQGILARRALGNPASDDGALACQLIARMQAETRSDGSLPGGVVATIWRIHELLDLGGDTAAPGWMGAMSWVLQLQGRPGAFSEGCTPPRHSYRACEHFISGFFSPAPPEQRIAPVMLPNGKVFRAEPAARFAISCLALRAAFRAGLSGRSEVDRHAVSLIHLQRTWPDANGYFAPDVMVAGLHAMAYATAAHRAETPELAAPLAGTQAEDGTWANADLFHCLEALRAIGTAPALAVVERATSALLARQRADGSFGSTAQQERALIALRALLWVQQKS
jgi:hypothetical protein